MMSISTKAEPSVSTDTSDRPRARMGTVHDEGAYRRRFWIKAPAGATKEDPLYSNFWSTISKQLGRHDIVTVLADDESWELELCIEAVNHNGAEVTLRKHYSRKSVASTSMTQLGDAGEFHSAWRASLGWCIIRKKDDFPVERGHQSEGAAILAWQRAQPKKVA